MNTFWKVIVIGATCIELCVIGYYGYAVYRKRYIEKNVLGAVSINPIKKENIVFSDEHSACYDYLSNSIIHDETPLKTSVQYTINADSLNERFNYAIEKPYDVFRIIVLGDSFSAGLFINTQENWVEKLEDLFQTAFYCNRYKKIEVINLAVSGYDISCSAYRYKRLGSKYNPDLILWFLKEDDFIEYREEMAKKAEIIFDGLSKEDKQKYRNPWGDIYKKVMEEIYKKYNFEEIVFLASAKSVGAIGRSQPTGPL